MPDPGVGELTTNDVFVNAVRDHLNDTPNASHPVQFETVGESDCCTLCGAMVVSQNRWRDLHRGNHDRHNAVHQQIVNDVNGHSHAPKTYR